jgi:hypothetical protein
VRKAWCPQLGAPSVMSRVRTPSSRCNTNKREVGMIRIRSGRTGKRMRNGMQDSGTHDHILWRHNLPHHLQSRCSPLRRPLEERVERLDGIGLHPLGQHVQEINIQRFSPAGDGHQVENLLDHLLQDLPPDRRSLSVDLLHGLHRPAVVED